MATNGQQIYFSGPYGTGMVHVTGKNQNNIISTWKGTADRDGNIFTENWWFKGKVEITYEVNRTTQTKVANVPGQGDDVYNITA